MTLQPLLNKAPPSKALDIVDNIVSVLINILIFLIAVISVVYILFIPFDIDGTSMEPNLHDGYTVVINKLVTPNKGDIVVIDTGKDIQLEDGSKVDHYIVKRIVATEGERVAFLLENGTVSLYIDSGNGFIKQEESFIKEPMTETGTAVFYKISVCESFDEMENNCISVPKLGVFALGDNRNVSSDSRKYGCFSLSDIQGVAVSHFSKDSFLGTIFGFLYKSNDTIKI